MQEMLDIPWYVFALLSALLVAFTSVIEKKVLAHENPLYFSSSANVLTGILSVPLLFLISWESVTAPVLIVIFIVALLATGGFLLVAYSLKHMDVGEQSLVLSTAPVATALLAYVVLGEALSGPAVAGMALIMIGLYLLEHKVVDAALGPKHHFTRKFVPLMLALLSVLIYAVGTVLDRIVLSSGTVGPLDFIILAQVFMMVNFVVIGFFRGKHDHFLDRAFTREPMLLASFSILVFLSRLTYAIAISMAYVALVAILKRTGALFSVILGGALLKEKDLAHRLFAGTVILLGVALVIL